MKKSAREIVRELESFGLTFSTTSQSSRGKWLSSDAEWNYRDIPHLNHVHSQVSGVMVVVDDDVLSSLFVQKIGPLKLILPVTQVCDKNTGQVYFTAVAGISIVIETVWTDNEDESGCQVVTTYHVGTPRWLGFLRPLVHALLSRNYKVLMSEDLPMREQRAHLRGRGFSFVQDEQGHSYAGSLKVYSSNLRLPPTDVPIEIVMDEGFRGRALFSNVDNTRSILVVCDDRRMNIYPAICPHEGADLGEAKCTSRGTMMCPWHGRQVSPMAGYDFDQNEGQVKFLFDFDRKELVKVV